VSASGTTYDAIIIGAGLNGLTTAAYLARDGLRVLVLERRASIGGSTITEEFAPGFSADTCRHHAGWVPTRIVRDLELARHGLQLLSTGSRVLALGAGGATLAFGNQGPDLDALKRVSPADAARWPEFAARVKALARFLEHIYAAPVPGIDASSFTDLAAAANLGLKFRGLGKRDMVELLRVLPMSIAEWLDDWFENPLLKGALASRGVLHACQGPRAAGTAFNFLHHQVGSGTGNLAAPIVPVGGVGALAQALARAATVAGATIRTDETVTRIVTRGGRATAVVLASGEEVTARRIVSGASPRATFLELCDPAQLAPEFVRAVRHVRYRGIWAKVNLAVERLPKFRGEDLDGAGWRGAVVAPTMDYLERAYDDAKYGRVSARPFLDVAFPRRFDDPAHATRGQVISIYLQYAPYGRRDGVWDDAARTALGDLATGTLAEYAPELPGLVKHRQVFTPLDLEQDFGLPEGHAYHGEIALDQALFMRPVPECSHYRTPVRGLYICGSGAHPGGGIAGGAGANAARIITADARKAR
jgi:phytoene dehydrogenase-like protein